MLVEIGRVVLLITILFLIVRLLGSKQITQLSVFDFIVGIAIGSMAASTAVSHSVHLIDGVIGIVLLGLASLLFSLVSRSSVAARWLLSGRAIVLVQNGKLVKENLKKSRMQVNDVLKECRMKGAFSLADVEYAILETSGKLSLLLKPERQPVTAEDIGLAKPYRGISIDLVIDGTVLSEHLEMIGHDELWLLEELKKQGVTSLEETLLASIDGTGTLTVDNAANEPKPLKP